nr:Ribosomal RNA large subunit methyltransferase I [Klebsiella pneumoniae]
MLQLLSAGAEYQRAAIISALQNLFPDCAIYDRSDVAVRKRGTGAGPGAGGGRTAPALLPITEHGMKLLVDIRAGTRPATTSTSATAAGHPPLCRG